MFWSCLGYRLVMSNSGRDPLSTFALELSLSLSRAAPRTIVEARSGGQESMP